MPDRDRHRGVFLDAPLLVLFVAGTLDPALIAKHRRLAAFSVDDFNALCTFLERVGEVLVTPNTLTEASNLLGQHGEPERGELLERLRAVIEDTQEITVSSRTAARRNEFTRLGLADAALIHASSADIPLLTVDGALYRAALDEEARSSVNFNHIRDLDV